MSPANSQPVENRGGAMRLRSWISCLLAPTPLPFFLRFAALSLTLGLLSYAGAFTAHIEVPLVHLNARLTQVSLNALGVPAGASGTIVHSGEFLIEVVPQCTGLSVFLILLAAILAYHGGWRWRLWGLFVGTALIFLLNHVRLVTLFLIGRKAPGIFDDTHLVIWQSFFILCVSLYFYWWAQRAVTDPGVAPSQPPPPR